MQVGDGDLGGGHQEQVIRLGPVGIFLELGELPGPEHALAADQEGRQYLRVAVLLGMEVQHEGDDGPLQLGAQAP